MAVVFRPGGGGHAEADVFCRGNGAKAGGHGTTTPPHPVCMLC